MESKIVKIGNFEGMMLADYYYRNLYERCVAYDQECDLNVLDSTNSFTFCADMSVYDKTSDLKDYYERMYKMYCKKYPQAYFEMVLSLAALGEICWHNHTCGDENYDEIGKLCNDLRCKMLYDESVQKECKIPEDKMMNFYRIID